MAVLGGSKVSDKLAVIEALLERCDTILVGGAMAFTFLVAQGYSIGDSLVELDRVDDCKRLLETGRVRVPVDVVIAAEIAEDAEVRVVKAGAIPDGWKGLDIGPETAVLFADEIDAAAHPALERADGRVRGGAVRRRDPDHRRGGGRRARGSP